MEWAEARRRLARRSAGTGLRLLAAGSAEGDDAPLRDVRAASLCVASGKGGTGKSVVTASFARLFASRGRVLVLDADLGVGNAHILQDVSPERTLVDVVEGNASTREALVPCGGGIDLLAGGSGFPRMAGLGPCELQLVAAGLAELERSYGTLLVDSAAGLSTQTMAFAEGADVVLVVTTPDLTAMTDAYAFLKVLLGRRPDARALLAVNRAADEEEAARVQARIAEVSERFLGRAPVAVGWIPEDPAVTRAVNARDAVVHAVPESPAARALRRLAVRVAEELDRRHPRGLGRVLARAGSAQGRIA